MRAGQLLFSCLHLLIIMVFFALGGLILELHYLPKMRHLIVDWLIAPQDHFFFWGSGILLFTVLIAIGFWALGRHQFLRISMNNHHFFVEENLVRQTILLFWNETFPESKKPLNVFFSHQKIEIVVPMPQKEDWQQTLQEIEIKLGKMLAEKFGYQKEFFVSLVLSKNSI